VWRARQARNDTVGHPVFRRVRKGESLPSFFIVQHGASVHGFEFVEMTEHGVATYPLRRLSFPKLIDGQMIALAAVLRDAAAHLDRSPPATQV
jgi:hypothetical protein